MSTLRHGARPGLREVSVVWGLNVFVAAEIFATYARLPVHELYHVSENGRTAGLGRALVFLNWPTALAAIPILVLVAAEARSRAISRLAVLATVLCAAVFWPGVVEQVDLDAKWSNAIAASGVLLALALTVVMQLRDGLGPRVRASGDRVRLVAAVVLVLIALPWIAADLGFLIGRSPLFGSIYYSNEWYAGFGQARLSPAVHAGNHHGMAGTLLALTAILLSRTLITLGPMLRRALGLYLAILLLYGLANIANDFWLEQIVKRGITNWQVPSMILPALTFPWLILLVLAAVGYVVLVRPVTPGRPIDNRPVVWPFALVPPVVALLVIGLVHAAKRHVTPLGSADGIAFAYAPEGTAHVFVTRGGELVQVTDGDGSDRAPAWSPDRRRIAFQSSRDGNWEIYVANPDGSGVRRLTDDDARDGEPSWSADGKRIAFVRDGDLYGMQASGNGEQKIGGRGEWPAWSPDGKSLAYDVEFAGHHGIVVAAPGEGIGAYGAPDDRRPAWSPRGGVIAYQCRLGEHWHICLLNARSGRHRVLTGQDSDAFAPAWSPDGSRIAFISDRDGNDQLFVMNADGAGVTRLTSGQAEKDTPTWGD